MYGGRECSNFINLHAAVQLSQHHLLKRLSFSHCIFLHIQRKDVSQAGIWRKVLQEGAAGVRHGGRCSPGVFKDHKETRVAGAPGVSRGRGVGGGVRVRG